MEFTTGELMMYGGAAAFVLLAVTLAVMLAAFGRSRKKLAKKIEDEINKD